MASEHHAHVEYLQDTLLAHVAYAQNFRRISIKAGGYGGSSRAILAISAGVLIEFSERFI